MVNDIGRFRVLGRLALFISLIMALPALGQDLGDKHPTVFDTGDPNKRAVFKVGPAQPPNNAAQQSNQLTLDKIDFVCYRVGSVARRVVSNTNAKSLFGKRLVLDIRIDDPDNLVTGPATVEMRREILFSVAVWRRMCTNCDLVNGAVTRLSNEIYADPRLLGLAQNIDYDNYLTADREPAPSNPRATNLFLYDMSINARVDSSVPLGEFVRVERTDTAIQKVCGTNLAKVPRELLGLREAAHCEGDAPPQTAQLTIHVLNGPTRCGSDRSIIACENGPDIELHALDHAFVKHGTSTTVFGNGTDLDDLQTVLMHELGHWTGIQDHLGNPNNIMSEFVDDCKCIDQAVVMRLATSTADGIVSGAPLELKKRGVAP